MRLLDPGLKARWRQANNGFGLMSVSVEFEAGMLMAKGLIEMLNSNEKFYALAGGQKIPMVVREVFVPAPDTYLSEPMARVRAHSVGAPEPYMQIRGQYLSGPTFLPSALDYRHPNCRCMITGTSLLASALAGAKERMKTRVEQELKSYLHKEMSMSFNKKEKPKMDKKTLKANRFYVGSERALRTGWGKPTLAAAVDHAKQLLEDTGDDQFVVQIVRVVKKKEQPVVVEAIK